MRYICSICGYVYDEAGNIPFGDLPEDWKCPLCGASKADFVPEGASQSSSDPAIAVPVETTVKPLSSVETSALCSNLAKGCENNTTPSRQLLSASLQPGLRHKAKQKPHHLSNVCLA